MKSLSVLLFALIAVPVFCSAAPLQDLYTVQVPVSDDSAGTFQRHLPEALALGLQQLTGNAEINLNDVLAAANAKPLSLVDSYDYGDIETPEGVQQRVLIIHLAPHETERVLRVSHLTPPVSQDNVAHVRVMFEGVSHLAPLQDVLRELSRLPMVHDVTLTRIDQNAIFVMLTINGEVDALKNALQEKHAALQAASDANVSDGDNVAVLSFQW